MSSTVTHCLVRLNELRLGMFSNPRSTADVPAIFLWRHALERGIAWGSQGPRQGPCEPRRAALPATLKRTLILGLWALPALCAFYMMVKHWVPLPYWDEWDTPGEQLASYYRGTLNLAELFRQQNETRSFFPRLLYLATSIAAGWDVRRYMILTFALACAGSVGLYQIVRQTSRFSPAAPFVLAAMNFLLFSPRQHENFLTGLAGQSFTPAVALIFAILMNLSHRSLRSKTLVNAALAFLATYTFANGMLVWLLAFPLETKTADRTRDANARFPWRVIYILAAIASVAGYFLSYRRPTVTPPFVSPIAQLPAFLHFVLVWIGSLFSTGAPAVCGAVVLLCFVGLAAAALGQMRGTGEWRPHYPWLVLGCYTLISGCVVAMGRLGFDYSMAGDARYTIVSAFLHIAVVGLGFSVYRQAERRPLARRIAFSAAAVSSILLLTFWGITFKKERLFLKVFTPAREHLLLVLRWSEAIPQNPEIALLSPYPLAGVVSTIRTLAQNDVFRPRLVSQRLANAVNEPPKTADAAQAGFLDDARLEITGPLVFHGWARLPEQNRPADCVVLGFETADGAWKPFCVVETGGNRPDLAGHFGNSAMARAGFSGRIDATGLPPGEITVKAWAIDLQNERAFPLDSAKRLQRRD